MWTVSGGVARTRFVGPRFFLGNPETGDETRKPGTGYISGFPKAVLIVAAHVGSDSTCLGVISIRRRKNQGIWCPRFSQAYNRRP
jgi:hypothetical protein